MKKIAAAVKQFRFGLKWLLTRHPLLTLAVMLASAAVFGLLSYNLFSMIRLNAALVADYGFQALYDGALEELVKLFFYGLSSLLFYLVFKACEKVLVEWVLK